MVTILYAQFVLTTEWKDKMMNKEQGDVSAMFVWILLEVVVFYSYIASAVAFIIFRQCRSTLYPKIRSDTKALLTDFISYAEINLTWFNFNFVLVTGPLIVLWVVEPALANETAETGYDVASEELDYWLIWVLFFCHLYQFTTKVEIFFVKESA